MEAFRAINGAAGKNPLLDALMLFVSEDMIFVVLFILILYYLFALAAHRPEKRKLAAGTAVFILLNFALSGLLGLLFYTPRPFVHNRVNLLYPHMADSSFPSDHTIVSMSTALGLLKGERVLGGALIAVSLIIGYSRVYVGQHTPADVLFTYLVVIAADLLYNRFLRSRVESGYEKAERWFRARLQAGGR